MQRTASVHNPCIKRAWDAFKKAEKPVEALKVQRAFLLFIMLTFLFLGLATPSQAVPPGTPISNTASAAYDVLGTPVNQISNTVDITTTLLFSEASLELFQFSPNGDGVDTDVSPTGCSVGNTGSYTPLPDPSYPGVGTIDISLPVNVLPAPSVNTGMPIFIRITDANRNFDSTSPDTVEIDVSSVTTGDNEVIELTETGNDTGIFTGFIQTVSSAASNFDCQFAVTSSDTVVINYVDAFDASDTETGSVLIDPFGVVFNSDNGTPVSGLTVTLIDAGTGLPATVFSDAAGTITYPSTMVTGNDVVDSGGNTFMFGPGEYRFPFVAAGTYRLEVTADEFVAPSTESIAVLQTLPGAPYALDSNASFGQNFSLIAGPPLNVDIPVDPLGDILFVTKQASKSAVGIGDFLQYQITVTNNKPTNAAIDVNLFDELPTGFRYQDGSLQVNDVKQSDPQVSANGSSMNLQLGDISSGETITVKYVVEVSSGTPFGKAVNSAYATDSAGFRSSSARATVDVQDDLLSSKGFLIGTVFEGTCTNENQKDYGTVSYQLESEVVGDNIFNTVIINKPQQLNKSLLVNVELPADLQYVAGTSRLDSAAMSEPQNKDGLLKFAIKNNENSTISTLTFSTLANLKVAGTNEIQVFIEPDESEDSVEGNYKLIKTSYSVIPDNDNAEIVIEKKNAAGQLHLVGTPTIKGVEGIRLYLEDGRYVLTDERGMYHFEGLEPGTHVVQIDPGSIPNHLEIQECVTNTRTSGSRVSQFADIDAGLLWRSNFYLKEKPPQKGKLITQIDSHVNENMIDYTISLEGVDQPLDNARVSVILPDGLEYVENSAHFDDGSKPDARIVFGTLNINVGDQGSRNWNKEINLKARVLSSSYKVFVTEVLITYDHEGEKNLRSPLIKNKVRLNNGNVVVDDSEKRNELELLNKNAWKNEFVHPKSEMPVIESPTFDSAWLDTQDSSLEWLAPDENYNPYINSIAIDIKHSVAHDLILKLNGKEVSGLNYDSRKLSSDGMLAITHWKGVDLLVGDNVFIASAYNEEGSLLEQVEKVIHYSGQPVRAEFVKEYSRLIADGQHPIVLAVKFFDEWGYPVRPGMIGTYRLSPGYKSVEVTRELDKQPLNGISSNNLTYKVDSNGIAFIDIEPTTRSGKVTLDFNFVDDREQTIDAWIKASQKEWLLVGLAEGTTGYNDLSGNMRSLRDNNIEDDLYEDGRLAFYAKGQIKGEWLLTLAYDSERNGESDERLFQTIAPDEYYTLYGDATEQQFDAASQEKLYIKMERNQFYALFGDFNTDLDVTELSKYTRSLNGAKAEYEGDRFGFNAFASETDQLFVQDEIRGNGTSGLYQLSHNDIVINSEDISIVTRDRFKPQVIIEDVQLSQFTDYTIDTNNGTIYFKRPIPSRDDNFNPVYIVADYEVESSGDKNTTAGIRASIFDKEKGIEVGITAISQGDENADGELVGADLEYDFSQNTQLRLEAARSSVDRDDGEIDSDALLAEVEHRTGNTNALVYFRRQEEGFGLDQQSENNDGTQRYGADFSYDINESLAINSQAFRDEVLEDDNQRTVADAELNFNRDGYGLTAGIGYAKDELAEEDDKESVLLKAGASKSLLDNKLQLRTNAEIDVTSDNSVDYPTRYIAGADYKLNDMTELFTEHEYTQGEDQDTNTTRIGTRLIPWNQAEINTSVEQQNSEDGRRLFSNLGLMQGWQFNDQLSMDVSIDRLDTLADPGATPFNDNVALSSGSVTGDFTALSFGANYVENNWSAASRVEYRTSDTDIQRGLLFGVYSEEYTGIGMALDTSIFQTDTKGGGESITADTTYALAFRPDYSPYTVLNRMDFSFTENTGGIADITTRKFVNNLNLNYAVDNKHQLGAHWGLKYVLDDIDGDEYDGLTQLLGLRYRYDLHRRVDLSFHTGLLSSSNSDNFKYSFGPSVGVNVYQNVWVSVGYNFDGFEDDDFTDSEYTAHGPFAKLRIKFDTNSMRSFLDSFK